MKNIKIILIGLICSSIFLPTAYLNSALDKAAKPESNDFKEQRFAHGAVYAPGELIVKFSDNVLESEVETINFRFGAKLKSKFKDGSKISNQWHLIQYNSSVSPFDLAHEYAKLPDVKWAEPNYIAKSFIIPNDPYYTLYQQNFKNINLEKAWDISTGKGTNVAVLDSGIAYSDDGIYRKLPEFENTCFVSGYDFVDGDMKPFDENGHGTHVAGTISSATNNLSGTAGIAFDACLMPIRVLDRYGYGTYEEVSKAIVWAADNGANIINLSLGAPFDSNTLREAVLYAQNKNVLIVSAVGNSGTSEINYPAGYNNVLGVGAVDFNEQKTYYSNIGSFVDITAPGGDINQDTNQDGFGDGILQQTLRSKFFGYANVRSFAYYFFEGTSQAAAHVSGAAALLYSLGITNATDIYNILISSAKDLGAQGKDNETGFGVLDAYNAVVLAEKYSSLDLSQININPVAQINAANQGFVGEPLQFDGSSSYDEDGQIVNYLWNFSDGSEAESSLVEHIFQTPGEYSVKLKVIDNNGGEGVSEILITIKEKQEAISAQVWLTDRSGNQKDIFNRFDRIYLKGKVESQGMSLKNAKVFIEIYYPIYNLVKKYNNYTDINGEFQRYLSRLYFQGKYTIKITITYNNLEPLVVEKSFEIE